MGVGGLGGKGGGTLRQIKKSSAMNIQEHKIFVFK
jgi:hypothetical protein